jgi:hypothetical protein
MSRRYSLLAGLTLGATVALAGSGAAFASPVDQVTGGVTGSQETIVTSAPIAVPAWQSVKAPSVPCPADTKLSDHVYYPGNDRITPGVEIIASTLVAADLTPQRDAQNNRTGIDGSGSMISNYGNFSLEIVQLVLHCVPK